MAELIKVEQARLGFLLEYAVRMIISGKVIAFPTDTFYGLGADPFNLAAVSEVFRIKRRMADRPLPLLVASIDQAADLTHDPPQLFFTLAKRFWPGPLTLVVPASRQIPLKVTANTGKVGLRWPRALLATALIEASARPLTGTSANLSELPGLLHGAGSGQADRRSSAPHPGRRPHRRTACLHGGRLDGRAGAYPSTRRSIGV